MLPQEFNTIDVAQLFPKADIGTWRRMVDADLKGASFDRRLVTHTYEGVDVQPLYTQADRVSMLAARSNDFPWTRAARSLGNVGAGWDIRQEHASPDLARVNAAIRDDLEGGVQSLVLRLDACARNGLDPLDPAGATLCGVDGIGAYDVQDLDDALAGVHLQMIGLHLEAGAAFIPGAALLAALWDRRGVAPEECKGGFQADPLAVLAREGLLPYSIGEGFARLADLAQWTSQRYANVRAVRVGTAPYHHAGATASQDLAFSMATAIEYVRAMTDAGLSVDRACLQLEFSYAVGCHFFLAIAKLRAARRLFARVVEACGGSRDASRMRMFVRPSKRVLTTRDPWVNILRNTSCAFAAGLAQADAIGTIPFDATLGEHSDHARRIARNTHHVLMQECHVHSVCDVAGGSWYIERLTDDLAQRAWAILQAIESHGGMAAALSSGWIAGQVDKARLPRLANIASRKDIVVGVSDFPNPLERTPRPARVDRAEMVGLIQARVRTRTAPGVGQQPQRGPGWHSAWCAQMASGGASVGSMSGLLATPGQLPATLPSAVHVHPYAEAFEVLRDASDAHALATGHRPRVCLACLGTPAQRLARANYCANLFETGGMEVLGAQGDGTPEGAIQLMASSGARIGVLCGPDDAYAQYATTLAPALRRAGAQVVVLAGNPGTQERAYRAAGIDRFVYVKADVVALLRDLLAHEGVRLDEGSCP